MSVTNFLATQYYLHYWMIEGGNGFVAVSREGTTPVRYFLIMTKLI